MDRMEMSRRQEATLAEVTGGRKTKGSGSQWTDQADVRGNRLDVEFAFAVECKSTGGQSIAVDRKMLAKLIEQAGGERPALALRIYESERYDVLYDWVAVRLEDFREMLERLNVPPLIEMDLKWEITPEEEQQFRAALDELLKGEFRYEIHRLGEDTAGPSDQVIALRAENAELRGQVELLGRQLQSASHVIENSAPLTDADLTDEAVSELSQLRLELESRPTQDEHRAVMNQVAQAEVARRDAEAQLGALQLLVTAAEAESPVALAAALGRAQSDISYLRQLVGVLQAQAVAGSGRRNELQATMAAPPPARADGTPKLPWTVVFKDTKPDGKPHLHMMHYDPTGAMTAREIPEGAEVRVENTTGQQRAMFVEGVRIRAGQLYVDGVLRATVDPDWASDEEPGNPLDQS